MRGPFCTRNCERADGGENRAVRAISRCSPRNLILVGDFGRKRKENKRLALRGCGHTVWQSLDRSHKTDQYAQIRTVTQRHSLNPFRSVLGSAAAEIKAAAIVFQTDEGQRMF